MRTVSRRVTLGLLLAGLTATAAAAQTPDPRWIDWMGCWDLVADGSLARLPPAEAAAGNVTEAARPGRSARVCVSPTQGGAQLRTFVGGQPVLSQTIVADGTDRPVDDGGCKGTQRAQWSNDGRRLFTRARVTCEGQPERTVTGLALMAPNGEWVDVQAVTIGGTDSVRVRRYTPPVERVRAGVSAAAARLQIADVKEATKYVSPRAIEAALMETGAQFPLSGRALVDLDKAGVDDRVIDLMVALSYPRSFQIRPSSPDDRLTPFPPFFPGGADFVDVGLDYSPYFGPFYSNYYYSPYFYSPFGYSYLRYYAGTLPPFVVTVPGGGGGHVDHDNRPPENGRAINGLGYTRVDRRGDVAISGGGSGSGDGSASTRTAVSRGTVSTRGYTNDSSSSSSSSSGGGSSSSGSSSGTSSGTSSGSSSGSSSGGDSGRTAVPR